MRNAVEINAADLYQQSWDLKNCATKMRIVWRDQVKRPLKDTKSHMYSTISKLQGVGALNLHVSICGYATQILSSRYDSILHAFGHCYKYI
jgi:hypothetical protein